MNNPEKWQRVEELFHATIDLPPQERATFLNEACGEDQELRREVESLLAFETGAAHFIQHPALQVAAQQLALDHDVDDLVKVPAKIGVYELHKLLGKGGMGEVWLATDTRLKRSVAIKLLSAEFSRDRAMLSRFEREARAASALNHPNILIVHDIGESEGWHYIATEYVEGETLRQRLHRERLSLTETTQIATQIATALTVAHQAGIIHRDLKPENVMVRPDGLVKVLDFGLAKQLPNARAKSDDADTLKLSKLTSKSGLVMGTASYMSPEQARGQKVDARTDIFSFGVMLHEMAAGEAPFQGHNSLEVIAAILERDPKDLLNVPAAYRAVVARALQKDRDLRYATIQELADELKTFAQQLAQHPEWETLLSEQVTAPLAVKPTDPTATQAETAQPVIATTAPVRSRWRRLERFALRAVAALVLLALLTAGGFWFYDWIRKPAIDSVAVLPFANMDKNPDAEYLCAGLSDSLINNLSRLRGLKVIARGSSFQFNSNNFDPQTVATSLGVRAIVSGSVSQRNNRMLITAELMDTQSKARLWGDTFDRPLGDLVAIQSEIARQVAEKLRVWLTKEVNARWAKQQKIAPEAYNLYLKAMYEGERGTIENTKKGIELLNQAIALEPQYTDAWLSIGGAYHSLAYQIRATSGNPSNEIFKAKVAEAEEYKKRAEAAWKKAKESDPDSVGSAQIASRLQELEGNWDWDNLERESRYALKLTPQNPHLLIGLSWLLTRRGQHDEAVNLMKNAYDLDPLSSSNANLYAQALMSARRYDEAIDLLKKKQETSKNSLMTHLFLADCYKYKKMLPEAEAEFETASKLVPDSSEIKNSSNYHAFLIYAGRRNEAIQFLNKMLAAGDADGSGIIYALLGEKEKALTALEQELTRRTPNMDVLGVMPEVDSLRDEPRFREILKQVGIYRPTK